MAKKHTSVSLDSEKLDALQVEADKREITRNELFDLMADMLLAGQPIISQIVDIDLQIKQAKLQHETDKNKKTLEQTRQLKNNNEFFEIHGYYPTKPANFVNSVISKPQEERQTVWYGANHNQPRPEPPKKDFGEFMPKKEITPDQWERIWYRTITELSSGKFSCSICAGAISPTKEEVKSHLHTSHGSELSKIAKGFGFL
ncbi:MAG: hypothetical protein ACREBJ_04240 [Nitrosotalea sp.]